MAFRRAGIRTRAALAFSCVVLVVVGGVSAALIYTVGPWIYSVTRSQAAEQFHSEAQQVQSERPNNISDLRDLLPWDVTAIVGDRVVNVGTAKQSDINPAFRTGGDTPLKVRKLPWGPNRVMLGTVITIRGAPGDGGAGQRVELYSIRPLLGVTDTIKSTVKVVALVSLAALVLSALLAAWLAGLVVRPLRRLDEAAARAANGDTTVRLPQQGVPELAELTATFNQMMRTHQNRLDQSKRFAADVSHELRTPLAALVPASEILEEEKGSMSPDAQVAAGLLIAESRNLARLVDDLIELSRYDSGRAALHLQPTDLVALSHNTIRHRGWQNDVSVAATPGRIHADVDPRRIELVVANLVGNAVRHGQPPVVLRLQGDATHATITVENAGPAIPAEVQAQLFNRFYKGEIARTRSEDQGGSGLGLSLVKENVQLHHGTVAVESVDGRTAFTVRLPLRAG
ncbi:HAMP domain-containing sensor histidine kinase [Luteipulveratus mongoliensis]|uniref:histidine kinase n=1 Tax=Luteipulveratus mongoliensis TaxID=571913 RepID=A0A0K1JFA1_9MICO|nr:HAMP domain-containing sensor histidine kinase [Luteipulveratus mongoliensis]AKU15402.1 hypothetical protein VV02_05185 [Luteipulveratus mongoliensis]